jgi:hypothetical protein
MKESERKEIINAIETFYQRREKRKILKLFREICDELKMIGITGEKITLERDRYEEILKKMDELGEELLKSGERHENKISPNRKCNGR